VDLDVISRARDVPHEPRERESTQITMAQARHLAGVCVDVACASVALKLVENGSQLARQLHFELVLRTLALHPPNMVAGPRAHRIKRLPNVAVQRGVGESRGVAKAWC